MGKHLKIHVRARILELHDLGPTNIIKQMAAEGHVVGKNAIYGIFKKWDEHQMIGDMPQPPRPRKDVTSEMLDFIDEQMETNDELTSSALEKNIEARFGVSFSTSKVKDLRRKLGWIGEKTRYCQLVREANRVKRLNFAEECLRNGDLFDDVIWSDESCIQMDWNGSLTFHRWWEPAPQKGKPKHPFKFNVWAGLSKRGATPILIFDGIMEKTFYCGEIIKSTLAPFLEEVFPDGHRFMQDNDPKHTSNMAKEIMVEAGINWWKTPPESPDMNPIENIWHELKHHLRNVKKPRTAVELESAIKEFWLTVTPEKCRKYISHLTKVLPKVVERNGRASGF